MLSNPYPWRNVAAIVDGGKRCVGHDAGTLPVPAKREKRRRVKRLGKWV